MPAERLHLHFSDVPYAVYSSKPGNIKSETARSIGMPLSPYNGRLSHESEVLEDSLDLQFSGGLPLVWGVDQYTERIATAKALGALRFLQCEVVASMKRYGIAGLSFASALAREHITIVGDSVWRVEFPDGRTAHTNKAKTQEDVELMTRFWLGARDVGAHIVNVSSSVVVDPHPLTPRMKLTRTEVSYGVLRPEVKADVILGRVETYGSYISGGIKSTDPQAQAFFGVDRLEVVVTENHQTHIDSAVATMIEQGHGHLISSHTTSSQYELSFDSVNSLGIARSTFGLV